MYGVDDHGTDDFVVTLWGVRGSIPTPGPHVCKYGGHTPCVEVRIAGRMILVDAGSGLMALGKALGEVPPKTIDLLFSHLHLDHIIGLPFFKPMLMGTESLTTYCGNLDGDNAVDALKRVFAPPTFPVTIGQLPCKISHVGFRAGETLDLGGGLTVRTIPLNHPSGATGYRFDHAGHAFCYLSDLEHREPWPEPDLVEFVKHADLVLFDAMFTTGEYSRCVGWGHSTWERGVELAEAGGVREFGLFHHDPRHDDAMLDAMEAQAKARFPGAFVAREGTSFRYSSRQPARAVA